MKKVKEVRDTLDPGDTITVVYGEEKYSPVQYQPFSVGPYSVTLTVREGEDAVQAFKRGHDLLEVMADKAFDRKMEDWSNRRRRVNERDKK